jgi:hypothetical protein
MNNGNIAAFMNRRTWKGGAGGKYGPAHTSRVMPAMEWFQRTTAWVTGDAILFFYANGRRKTEAPGGTCKLDLFLSVAFNKTL